MSVVLLLLLLLLLVVVVGCVCVCVCVCARVCVCVFGENGLWGLVTDFLWVWSTLRKRGREWCMKLNSRCHHTITWELKINTKRES